MLERFFLYVPSPNRVTLAANQFSYDNRIEIRQNADFYMRAFAAYVSNGSLAWRAKRADSSWWTGPTFAHLSGFCVTGGFARWSPIYPQFVYPKSGAFVYDLQELAGAEEPAFFPMLIGAERYQDGEIPGPALPDKYVEYDYEISMPQQTITGVGTQLLDIPIRCKTGDPFIIRSMSWRYDESSNQPFTLHFKLKDEYGRAYMNDFVPLRLAMAGPTEADSPYLATPFPEMVIPANGAYTIDLFNRTEAGPFTVDITFKGVRLGAVEGA
jgi:hypothetical protein